MIEIFVVFSESMNFISIQIQKELAPTLFFFRLWKRCAVKTLLQLDLIQVLILWFFTFDFYHVHQKWSELKDLFLRSIKMKKEVQQTCWNVKSGWSYLLSLSIQLLAVLFWVSKNIFDRLLSCSSLFKIMYYSSKNFGIIHINSAPACSWFSITDPDWDWFSRLDWDWVSASASIVTEFAFSFSSILRVSTFWKIKLIRQVVQKIWRLHIL